MKRRAFVIVIDACGAGELPDSVDYGDAGANTLGHVADACGGLELPALTKLGLGSIMPLKGAPAADDPVLHGRLAPQGPGKETITGHWELMGVVTPVAMRTYPDGFPPDVLDAISKSCGRGILCNAPYSGTEVIADYGERHLRSGDLIVYTSADSVLQIAAHEDVIPIDELYRICRAARKIMSGEHSVGRVIARPFVGEPGSFTRTTRRKDFAVAPPSRSYLQELQASSVPVHSVGKVANVFTDIGIDSTHPGATNIEALASTSDLVDHLDHGLVFVNLVETDQLYGHRNDPEGFHEALKEIDRSVASWCQKMNPLNDMLVLTADHGCDPTMPGTDHSREHVPLLARFAGHRGRRYDGAMPDVGASVLQWLAGRQARDLPGNSFIEHSATVIA